MQELYLEGTFRGDYTPATQRDFERKNLWYRVTEKRLLAQIVFCSLNPQANHSSGLDALEI